MDLGDQIQSTLGDAHTVERELGGGGMSRVFVAIESALGCVTLAADESDVYIMEIALTYALPNGLCA